VAKNHENPIRAIDATDGTAAADRPPGTAGSQPPNSPSDRASKQASSVDGEPQETSAEPRVREKIDGTVREYR
jgi:hypothetical protein